MGAPMPLVSEARALADFAAEGPGRRVLFESELMRAVLVALEAEQEIPIHAPDLDLIVSVLMGTGRLAVGKEMRWVRAGDVAVIPAGTARGLRAEHGRLVALNVVSPPPGELDHAPRPETSWPPLESTPNVEALVREEHRQLHREVAELAELAESISRLDPQAAQARLERTVHFLQKELLSHAQEEERSIYPAAERVLRAVGGATATMVADHRRIATLAGSLEEIATHRLDDLDRQRARQLLYALHALLEIHFDKEENLYLPLLTRLSPEERHALYTRLAGEEPA
jgi:quercetin dioxygenase-like cupin family protein/hemerythrin-like domain-containing protein